MTIAQIRQQAVAILKANNTAAGSRVFDSRTNPVADIDTLPALYVYTPGTTDQSISMGTPTFRSTIPILIVGAVEDKAAVTVSEEARDATLMANLDALEIQVRAALMANATWVAQFEKIISANCERGHDSESDRRRAKFALRIELQQTTNYEPAGEGIPIPAVFVPLESLHIDADLYPPDGVYEARAEVDLT